MNNKQTALITGTTSGIGEAYVRRLASDGYDLIITGRRSEKIHALANELSQVDGSHKDTTIDMQRAK